MRRIIRLTLSGVLLTSIMFTAMAGEKSVRLETFIRNEFPTETLYRLWHEYQKDDLAIVRFYESLTEKHIVEPVKGNPRQAIVTYFAKGGSSTDFIMQSGGPDLFGLRFKRFGDSDIYFCIQNIPSDAWFTYGVNEFKCVKLSEVNGLRQSSTERILDGAVIGPNAPLSSYINANKGTPKGQLRVVSLNSKHMGDERKVVVYTPAEYNANVAHKLVLQFDGQNYLRGPEHGAAWEAWTPMPIILDNLIHEKLIPPTIVIFIHNKNRSLDLLSEKMADFVALELVGWARKHYTISPYATDIIVSGPSRAGFAAANTALRHSSIVGGVLSQSGSFYYTLQGEENWPVYPEFEGKLVLDYKRTEKRDINFYLDIGLYDLGLGAVGTNRQLRDILELKEYSVDYFQYKGGHSHLGWRHTLPNGLISLLNK